jgi:hypothetical protein
VAFREGFYCSVELQVAHEFWRPLAVSITVYASVLYVQPFHTDTGEIFLFLYGYYSNREGPSHITEWGSYQDTGNTIAPSGTEESKRLHQSSTAVPEQRLKTSGQHRPSHGSPDLINPIHTRQSFLERCLATLPTHFDATDIWPESSSRMLFRFPAVVCSQLTQEVQEVHTRRVHYTGWSIHKRAPRNTSHTFV